MKNSIIKDIKNVIRNEGSAIRVLQKHIDARYIKFIQRVADCRGRVILTGVGKSGIIAQKIAATFSSTGTASFFLDAAAGIHGDLGVLVKDDIVIALSKSGNTEELLRLLPHIKRMGIYLASMTENPASELGKHSDIVLKIPAIPEACPYNLAPTTSTTLQLVLGDALAVALLKEKKFAKKDFASLHPGGNLGRQLMLVKEVMRPKSGLPIVDENASMEVILNEIISGKIGVAVIVDKNKKLAGIIVDGDLKRILLKNKGADFFHIHAKDVMTRNPKIISPDSLVVEALAVMQGRITSLVVTDKLRRPVGIIHMHDILQKGFI